MLKKFYKKIFLRLSLKNEGLKQLKVEEVLRKKLLILAEK